ncbi:type VI secretion system Vgr family protein, partial [Chromobacterium vaccinii]|uniref:type VI secretion system Vgr family protein n=1 Tax=Chromobacterium vaccinii TaxID=1108595 RepID=UPI003D68A1A5
PGKTQLNQGYLAHPRSNGKAQPRGDGFELRTDNHGAIRAAHGLLLSTEAQNGASGKQLAREHAQSQLDAALSLSQALAETAAGQLADTMETGPDEIGPDNAKAGKKPDGHEDRQARRPVDRRRALPAAAARLRPLPVQADRPAGPIRSQRGAGPVQLPAGGCRSGRQQRDRHRVRALGQSGKPDGQLHRVPGSCAGWSSRRNHWPAVRPRMEPPPSNCLACRSCACWRSRA